MKLQILLHSMVLLSCHIQLAMDNTFYNSTGHYPHPQHTNYENNQKLVNAYYPVYEYPGQENIEYLSSSDEYQATVYAVVSATQKTTKKVRAVKPRKRIIRSADAFDWASYWAETNKNNNNSDESDTAATHDKDANIFPIKRSFSINALINNPKPRKRTQANREKSPATAAINKKKFSIACCNLTITNFHDLKKHIKERHHTTDDCYEAVYNNVNHFSYTSVALAASKVASLAVPGFFDCPFKDCAAELTSLVSLRNHYKNKHGNQSLNNK